MNITVILFLIIRIFSNPLVNVFRKKLAVEISPAVINFYSYLLLSLSYIPFVKKYIYLEYITQEFLILVFVAGLLCTLGVMCIIKAVKIGELSIFAPLNSYKCIVGLLFAIIFLREIPSCFAIIGIILIIFGSKIIFDNDKGGFSFNLFKRADIQFGILSMIFTGVEAVVLKKIIMISSVEACFICWCFMGCFWSFLILLITKQNYKIDHKTTLLPLMIIALCLGFMQYSTNYVFKNMNVGYALALFQLSSIVSVVFCWKFFGEQSLIKKAAGCLIMVIGAVFIILN